MTDARRKTKIVLLQQKKTLSDLAQDSGLAEATIHNVLDGRASSRKSKQAITNALQVQIWCDTPITERYLTFPKGTEIQFKLDQVAKDAEEEFAGFVVRNGRTIIFKHSTRAVFTERLPARRAGGT